MNFLSRILRDSIQGFTQHIRNWIESGSYGDLVPQTSL